MRILFFCNCVGNFGNATRISKAYEYIRTLYKDVRFCNLYDWHDSWAKLLTNRSLLTSAFKNINTMDIAFIKSEAFVSLGENVLKEAIKRHRPDIIFAEETRTAHMALRNQDNIPVVADVHGIISAEYSESPNTRISERHLSRIKEIEKELFEKASDILVVSNNMKDYLLREYEAEKPEVTVVQNGADLHHKYSTYKEKMKLIFGGIFNYWEDVDAYVDMAGRDSKSEYYLIGTGPLQSHLLNRIKQEKIKINYLGTKDRTEALDLFCEMGIGVAPSTRNVTRYVASPVKVYDYMGCGLPVITPRCGEWAQHVEENDCGLVTENSNAEEFLECADKMRDKEVWEEKSNNGREAIKTKFNWNRVLAPIRDVLEKY